MATQTESIITATLVPDAQRLDFLPRFFGMTYLRGESDVYHFMGHLSPDYSGGEWDFYELSNGGFYMSLCSDDAMQVDVVGSGFSGKMSADAASIIANLFALGQMARRPVHGERFADLYHALYTFACQHPEGTNIRRAVD